MNTRAATDFQDERDVTLGPAHGDGVGVNRQCLPALIGAGRRPGVVGVKGEIG